MTTIASTAPSPSLLKKIPGDAGLPVLGYTADWIRDPVKFLDKRYQKYGEVSWSSMFGIKMVQMLGPDANQFVLQNRDNIFSNNQGWDYFIGKFFTRGIMLLDFEEHRHHRKIMQAAFKKPVLVEYLNEMNPEIDAGLKKWKARNKFEFFPAIKQLTLDLATHVFMGYELGKEADQLNKAFIDAVRGGTAFVRYPVPGGRWQKGLKGRKVLVDFFKSQIDSKRGSDSNDMFSQLCRAETEDGERFSDEDVINHMIFLMMAAHDTSTITLSNMLYYLAKYPEWQDRLREESRSMNKAYLDHEDLDSMTGMTMVMKESLRLCSPVPSLPRKTVKDCEYKGFFLPKGTMINVIPFYTHYMEEIWPNRFQFDPERFSDARREDKVHPFAWIPFGGGAHMCIGLHFADLQVKAILHQLLLNYRWSVPKRYNMPLDMTSLPVPGDNLPVRLRRLK